MKNWNVRTLRRQTDSALFLRLDSSRDKEGILKLAQNGIEYVYGLFCNSRAMKLQFLKIELKYIIRVLFQQIKHRKVMWREIKDLFVEIL